MSNQGIRQIVATGAAAAGREMSDAVESATGAREQQAETVWDRKKRRMTNAEVLERLETAPAHLRVPGRTLLKDHSWDGRDIPGHGQAAQRRLRQMAKSRGQV